MFLQNKPVLLSDASVIRHETADRHNTAERVGSLLIDIINSIDATFTAVDAYIQDLVSDAVAKIPGNSGGGNINIDLSSYATRTWVESQKYLKAHQDISHLLPKQTFDSMFELVTPDEGAPYIRAKYSFASVGEIVNHASDGLLVGSPLLGAVDILSPEDGQMLVYRNGRWVNESVAYGGGGIDEAQLASYLSRYGYVTNSVLGNYMTLNTQQTITAVKVFAEEVRFIGNGTYSDPAVGVRCGLKSQLPIATGGFIKAGGTSSQFLMADGCVRKMSAGGARFDVVATVGADGVMEVGKYIDFHETSTDTSDYAGRLMVNDRVLYYNDNKVWHTGNDGSNSGLNADLLDGLHAASFLRQDIPVYKTDGLSCGSINAINSNANNWLSHYNLSLCNDNNAMNFYVGGTQNERTAMIQVGHNNTNYAQYLGKLYLNPLGGNVSIGSTSSRYKVDIAGEVIADGWFRVTGNRGFYNETYFGGIYMDSVNWVKLFNKPLYIGTLRNIGANHFNVALKMENSSNMGFECQGGSYVMGMGCHNNGSWYWWRGTNGETVENKSYVMQFDGTTWNFTGNMLASGEMINHSDRRLKFDIADVKARGRLRPVSYTKDGSRHIGLIAQDMRPLCPEVVREGEDPRHLLGLNYIGALCYGFAGVYAEIDALKEEVKNLRRLLTR